LNAITVVSPFALEEADALDAFYKGNKFFVGRFMAFQSLWKINAIPKAWRLHTVMYAVSISQRKTKLWLGS
jgi:hypothetical protein